MEQYLNFNEIISLLKSNNLDKNIRPIIYESLDQIIKNNYQYVDYPEREEEEYEELKNFFENLLNLHEINLIKKGIKILHDININRYSFLFYDLALSFLENEMLKEYYEMIARHGYDQYFISDVLIESMDNTFAVVEDNKVYYLITEAAIFAVKNKEYDLMKFLIEKWNGTASQRTIGFDHTEMSDNDIELTTKTIRKLEDILKSKI